MQTHIINRNIVNYIQMHIIYAINIELYANAYSCADTKRAQIERIIKIFLSVLCNDAVISA